MITIFNVIDEVRAAIAADGTVNKLADRYKKSVRFIIGHLGTQALWQDSTRVNISIAPSTEPYDVGYSGEQRRTLPLSIRIGVYDDEVSPDESSVEHEGVRVVSEMASAVCDCVRAIPGLGDELTNAEIVADSTETWPLCVALIELRFGLSRGLAYEPAVT